MATVRVNRELLGMLVDDLQARHDATRACCLEWIASAGARGGPCPTAQRLERIKGVMARDTGPSLNDLLVERERERLVGLHGPWDKEQQRYEDGCKAGDEHEPRP